MRPDLIVRRAGRVALAGGCKCKRLAPGQHGLPDLYQLLAYCTALGVDRGLLVYPRHLAPVDGTVAVRNAGVTIREVSIDLGVPRDRLGAEGEALARVAFGLAESGSGHAAPGPS